MVCLRRSGGPDRRSNIDIGIQNRDPRIAVEAMRDVGVAANDRARRREVTKAIGDCFVIRKEDRILTVDRTTPFRITKRAIACIDEIDVRVRIVVPRPHSVADTA